MANYYNPYQNNPMFNQYYPQMQQQPTIQQGGFVPVSSEKEAMDYLVAQGTSVTFIDGGNSKMYVKTRGFSPMEQPTFKRYAIVEITEGENKPEAVKEDSFTDYVKKGEIEALQSEIEQLKATVNKMNRKVKKDE